MNRIVLLLVITCLSLITGCGMTRKMASTRENPYHQALDVRNYGLTQDYPKSFTVYPFKNTTSVQNAGERARSNCFQAFSLLGPCSSMYRTDVLAKKPYTSRDALRVAREQGSDAVIIGEAVTQDHTWLGLLDFQVVMIDVNIYDTRTGKLLWQGTTGASDYDAGLIVLFYPIADLFRGGAWSRTTMDLYHRASIDLVNSINPSVLPVK